jgi:hypothetical protein
MKVLRLVKLLNFFFQKIELFNQVKVLIKKIFLCLPLCKNVLTMLFFIFYIFAVIGVEIFNPAPLNNSYSKRDCSVQETFNFSFGDWGCNLNYLFYIISFFLFFLKKKLVIKIHSLTYFLIFKINLIN